MRYIHFFENTNEYGVTRNYNYLEPWLSLVTENQKVNYNKNENEKKISTPLTFEITRGGKLYWRLNKAGGVAKTIDYKKNNGDWVTITSTTGGTVIDVTTGDIIQFRGDNEVYSNGDWFNSFDPTTANTNNAAIYVAKGNIMSLINKTNFPTIFELGNNALRNMFIRTKITDASNLLLPARKVGEQCYTVMFKQCDILQTAPSILPATTLASKCYSNMFEGCTSLTTAPSILPATTLANGCYISMFSDCRSLTTAPELPATTLTEGCYNLMFKGCTSLTQAPELPAVELASYCYRNMFSDCTSLTTAPELPATILIDECYRSMFNRCNRLNYIKCLATDISASNCTYAWTSSVSSTGTFVTPSTTAWSTGTSGIPNGWTKVNA